MKATEKKTILVVDDAPDDIAVVDEILKDEYRVKVATSGEAALRIARDDPPPDLILLDIMMPGIDGYEICRRLKMDEEGSAIPVIFLTAKTKAADESRGFEVGAVDFVSKPFDPGVVKSRIKVQLEMREEAVKASEIRYRRLFETAKDGILIVDAESGRILDVNPFMIELLGYPYEEYLGKRLGDLGFLEGVASAQSRCTDLPRGEPVCSDDLPLDTIAGLRIEVECVTTVYQVNHRDVMQCNIRDITRRKHAEEEIRQLNADLERHVVDRTKELESANKELEAFSYSVSHDLRAPLRAIEGFSRVVMDDHASRLDGEGIRCFGMIRNSAEKMDRLITDLLSLSRITRSEIKKTLIDMTALVDSVYREIAGPEIREKFAFSAKSLPDAYGDPSLLRQVWINLLANAIKYTTPKSERRIDINGRAESGEMVYCIKDNGVGFNPAYGHKLFGVFQRLHSSEKFEGTGVGLAIVQRIIHRHGGLVWAEGKEGEGATFWFSLPSPSSEA